MSAKAGWHRQMAGMYKYVGADGTTLAYVERYRSFWNVAVVTPAYVKLPDSPHTLREAKSLALAAYDSKAPAHRSRGRLADEAAKWAEFNAMTSR
jgi:hypothetical protein